jgi:hypothetical protein
VETEQFLIYKDNVFHQEYLRGSVPLFWTQTGVCAELSLLRPLESSHTAFVRHFQHLLALYGKVHVLNLLNNQDKDERFLLDAFDKMLFSNKDLLEGVAYQKIDGSTVQKSQKVQLWIVQLVKPILDFMQYTQAELKNPDAPKKMQAGICRINSLDCLDKTNEMQMLLAAISMTDMVLIIHHNVA